MIQIGGLQAHLRQDYRPPITIFARLSDTQKSKLVSK
jgi:hypothetical protein